jgi:hypothetical protein
MPDFPPPPFGPAIGDIFANLLPGQDYEILALPAPGFRNDSPQPHRAPSEQEAEDDENFGIPFEEEDDAPAVHNNHAIDAPAPAPEPEPEPEPDSEPEDDPNAEIPAFDEPPAIRNIYINAWVQKTLHHATHRSSKHYLRSFDELLSGFPGIAPHDISRMARSISTVERRLGLATSDLITTYSLCPGCYRRYSPDYIANVPDAHCQTEGCEGILFTEKILANGARKRTPALTFPLISIKSWVQRMLSRDGYPELIQTWRKQGDYGPARPISSQDWLNQVDLDEPLGCVTHGWDWRSRSAGLERVHNARTGVVFDRSMVDPPIRYSNLPFSLSLSMNVDWYDNTIIVLLN